MMDVLTDRALRAYRAATYRTRPRDRLRNVDEAVAFVNERGFIFFWPIKGVELPSLWTARAGDRPVPDNHHDPAHVTWDWKDRMLGKRRWFYTRLLKRRNTIISLAALPYFYALSPNYGDPESDYLEQYEQGLLTRDARQVYEALLEKGPMDTIALREESRLGDNYGRFNRAIEDLQIQLRIQPVGISRAGAWRYAFIYDLVHQQHPGLIERAGRIRESQARQHLLQLYLASVGAAPEKDIQRLFGWSQDLVQRAVNGLIEAGRVTTGVPLEMRTEPVVAIRELLENAPLPR